MSASELTPLFLAANSKEDLVRKIIKLQTQQMGKVSIITITQDQKTKEWVVWYYPVRYLGGGLM